MNHLIVSLACDAILFFLCAASAAAQTAPATPAKKAATLLQQGQSLAEQGRLAEAEVPLSTAAALTPDDSRILTLLAEVKSRMGENQHAVAIFRSLVYARPRSATAHLNLAIALADAGDRVTALREVDKAIVLEPRSFRAHLNRARLLADTGRPSDARAEFQRAGRLNSADPEVNFFWGIFEKDEHQPQAAASLLSKVVAAQPQNGPAYFLLGQTLETLGKDKEAIIALQHAVSLNPSSAETVYALSQALRKSDPAAAAQLMQKFQQLRADEQHADQAKELGNQAYVAMQQKAWTSAISSLQQAMNVCRHCSLEADLHQRLGLAECHAGELQEGERELRIALAMKPDDRQTVEALQWVSDQKKQSSVPH